MLLNLRRRASGALFIHPMNPTTRTAILSPGFQETKLVRVFPHGWNEEAARFKPSSIAGPVEQLRRLTKLDLRLRHAVIVFTYGGEAALCDDDRDIFWEAFGVPVFEQYLGRGNELLAVECDAHTGLHLVGDFETLNGSRKGCACGSPNPCLPKRARIAELAELLTAVGAPAVGVR
jgi:hypothetical protein